MATKRTKTKARAGGRKSPKRVQAGRKAARTRKINDTVKTVRKTARATVRTAQKTVKNARTTMNRRAGARKAAATRAKGGTPEKRARARRTAAARRAAGASTPRRQGQRFGRNTVGAAMKKMDRLAKTSPAAARREEEKILNRARTDNSLITRVTKTARKAADAVVGTGASLYETVLQ